MSENNQKKEKHEIECSEEKSKKMSAFAKKKEVERASLAKEKLLVLLYKDVYFTNEFHSSFPCEVDSLLQEFIDVFPDEVPHGLPTYGLPKNMESQIDLSSSRVSVQESRLGQLTPSRPADSTVQQPMREQPCNPIRSDPITSSTLMIQRRGHLSSSSVATSLLENLPHHSKESSQGSETEKPNIVRGDRFDYQRTLVDPILNVLANRGEPSPFFHGDCCRRRIQVQSNVRTPVLSPYQPREVLWQSPK
ncbi:hypothetical protein CR513_54247, partial [Mucuna pruriens]